VKKQILFHKIKTQIQ